MSELQSRYVGQAEVVDIDKRRVIRKNSEDKKAFHETEAKPHEERRRHGHLLFILLKTLLFIIVRYAVDHPCSILLCAVLFCIL